MTPLNEPLALLLPTVRVDAAFTNVSTVPAPFKPLIVSLKPFMLSVAPTLRVTLPLPTPSGMTLLAPNCNVPPLTTVLSA